MTLVLIPTEQTTAATDLLITAAAIYCIAYLRKQGPGGLRGVLWRSVFVLLALASLFGAIGHGLVLTESTMTVVWWGVYLSLSLLIAAFFVASTRDLYGDQRAKALAPYAILTAVGFFAYFVIDIDNFLPFVFFEAAVMLFALAVFISLAWRGALPGSGWIAASIAVNILAAAIQATRAISFTLVWPFDHNGVFHLVQLIGMALLMRGLAGRSR